MQEFSDFESGLPADRIQSEIENLRSQFEKTQDLYREVCALLFFRYGITPTANKLYQLVRKGSMSAPAEALSQFWKTLREKSRIRMAHPELPSILSEAAGEMLGTLWQRAQVLAHENLDAVREEAKASALEARTLAEAAAHQAELTEKSLQETQAQLRNCNEQLQMTQQLLAKEEGEKMAMQRQLENEIAEHRKIQDMLNSSQKELEAQRVATTALSERYQVSLNQAHLEIERERANLLETQRWFEKSKQDAMLQQQEAQAELQRIRQEFTLELERQRAIVIATEKRYQEDLRRASQNLDHERSHLLRSQKDLEYVRHQAAEQATRDRLEIEILQQERIKLSQKFGELEGALVEARAARDALRKQLGSSLERGYSRRTGRAPAVSGRRRRDEVPRRDTGSEK